MKSVAAFGELMVRLAPRGYLKLLQADSFDVNYTGAEANVCVSLSMLGMPNQFVTKLPDNDISAAARATLRKYGVGMDFVATGGVRLGVYYLERGASQRPSKITYDRKYSAISMAGREDFDWDAVFTEADWFHFTGITAALSGGMPQICEDACMAAKRHGVTVSCDLNYRKALWSKEEAQACMTRLMPYIDIVIGNEEDASTTLGVTPSNTDVSAARLDYAAYSDVARQICERYGDKTVSFTLRTSRSASDNSWAGMLYAGGESYFSRQYDIHMVDRVGGGDSFSAGLIYAFKNGFEPQRALEFAVAASCLKQTMEYDFNLSTLSDILRLMSGDGSGRVQR